MPGELSFVVERCILFYKNVVCRARSWFKKMDNFFWRQKFLLKWLNVTLKTFQRSSVLISTIGYYGTRFQRVKGIKWLKLLMFNFKKSNTYNCRLYICVNILEQNMAKNNDKCLESPRDQSHITNNSVYNDF